MNLATFCARIAGQPGERFRSRFLTGVSVAGEVTLLGAYGEEFERVPVAPLVRGERFVIMPQALFQDLEEAFATVRARGKVPVLLGLDAYLGLLDCANRKDAFLFLLRFANATGREATVAILRGNWPEMEEVFSNPALRGNDWIAFSPAGPDTTDVAFVPRRFAAKFGDGGSAVATLPQWLQRRADGAEAGGLVAVQFNAGPFPGLDGGHVRQAPDARSFLAAFCAFDGADGMDDAQCDWLLKETDGLDVGAALARRFFPNGAEELETRALARFGRIMNVTEKGVFLKFLSRRARPDGYLARVLLRTPPDGGLFEENYLRPSQDDLVAPDSARLAEERTAAVKALEPGKRVVVETAQEEFIDAAKAVPDATIAPWLGLGLPCEEREWIRRHMTASGGVSVDAAATTDETRSRFLRAYLSKAGTGVAALDSYFRDYRERKVANEVDAAFATRAASEEFPGAELYTRDGEIAKAAGEAGAFLLVVDGLGAEWLPFLVALANEHNLRILEAKCVAATLPTSTEFNPTLDAWGARERYRKIDDLDKVYHKQGLAPEEGLALEFAEVERALGEVRQELAAHERVFLTSDHGASRLAALAYEKGLVETLKPGEGGIPAGLAPKKWRFAAIPDGGVVSCERVEGTLSGQWTCVRGYDRFSVSGGPTFELHGGATLEERVVPWIAFGKGFVAPFEAKEEVAAANPTLPTDGQIEEDEAFDI